jgi:hypothetical protein
MDLALFRNISSSSLTHALLTSYTRKPFWQYHLRKTNMRRYHVHISTAYQMVKDNERM